MTRSIHSAIEAGSRDMQGAPGNPAKNVAVHPSSDVTSRHEHPVRDARQLISTIRSILGQSSLLPDALPGRRRW